jgi:PAS domain S-box-containing protein
MPLPGIPTISLSQSNGKVLRQFPGVRPHVAMLRQRSDHATHAALSCLNQALTYEAEWNRKAGLTQDPRILTAVKNSDYDYLTNIGFDFTKFTRVSVFLLSGESVAAVKEGVFSDPLNAIQAQHNFYREWLVGKYEANWELWYHAPVGHHTLDMEGNITAINQTGTTMLGFERPGELVGKSIFEFVLPDQRAEAENRFRKKLAGNELSPTHDRVYVRESGTWIYLAAHDKPNFDPTGNLIGIKTALVDVTKLNKLQKQLHELEVTQALLRIAAGLADALNNQLTGISGRAEFFLKWLSLPLAKRKDNLAQSNAEKILSACQGAREVVNMLLGYAGTRDATSGTIIPRMISHYVKSNFEKPSNIEFDITDDAASWYIMGDNQLYEAVMHLVNNAKEAIGNKPGKIELTLRNRKYKKEIRTNSGILPAGRYVELSVKDDGPGIDQKDHRKIFEPFYSKKGAARQSKGWGLAVTLGVIVRSCKGGITLQSKPGQGSTFTLIIPARVPSPTREHPRL